MNQIVNFAIAGNFKMVEVCVDMGCDSGLLTKALECAVRNGHIEIAKYLISKGTTSKHILTRAVYSGNLEMVKYVNENTKCDSTYSAMTAKSCGFVDIFNYLVTDG